MISLKMFKTVELSNKNFIKGGATPTGGGVYNKGGHKFAYDSDSTTWEPNSMSWINSYYGIRSCVC